MGKLPIYSSFCDNIFSQSLLLLFWHTPLPFIVRCDMLIHRSSNQTQPLTIDFNLYAAIILGVKFMATIRCPHCGSPVIVRNNSWECGWCGDSGLLPSLHPAEYAKLMPIDDTALEDLERGVFSILNGIQEYLGDGEEERTLACKLAVYGMSHALLPLQNQTPYHLQLLQTFFQHYTFCTADEVLGAVRNGKPAFESLFVLSKERVGLFWESFLPDLQHNTPNRVWPDWLYQILNGLSQIESCFSDEDSSDIFDALQDTLSTYRLFTYE